MNSGEDIGGHLGNKYFESDDERSQQQSAQENSRVRRRIDHQFTSSSAKYYIDRGEENNTGTVDLHDIRVQPFNAAWNANSSEDDEDENLLHLQQQQRILQ